MAKKLTKAQAKAIFNFFKSAGDNDIDSVDLHADLYPDDDGLHDIMIFKVTDGERDEEPILTVDRDGNVGVRKLIATVDVLDVQIG